MIPMGKSKAKPNRKAKSPPSRGEFLDRACILARLPWDEFNLREKAISKLRRRYPGLTRERYANAIDLGRALVIHAKEVVQENAALLWQQWKDQGGVKARGPFEVPSQLRQKLRKLVPGFKNSTCDGAISWTFYFWHMR